MKIPLVEVKPKVTNKSIPALLFVHGAWHGAWCWQINFMPFFAAKGFECYAFDLPKHGASKNEKGINKLRIYNYVDALKKAINKIGKPVILIGHSMGGYVIQKYLEKESNCKGVVLMATVPGKPVWRLFFNLLLSSPLSMIRFMGTLNASCLIDTPKKAKRLLFSSNLPKKKLAAYFEALGNESFNVILFDFLFSSIKPRTNQLMPLLVQCAANDRMVSLSENKYTAILQNADFQFLKFLAHDMMLEENWKLSANNILWWIYQHFPECKHNQDKKLNQPLKGLVFSNAIKDIITNLPTNQKEKKNHGIN